MELECDLMVDSINGSLPFERKWEEAVEKHLSSCSECREMVEAMSELTYLVSAETFSANMKARILANVFEEEYIVASQKKSVQEKIACLSFKVVLFLRNLFHQNSNRSRCTRKQQ